MYSFERSMSYFDNSIDSWGLQQFKQLKTPRMGETTRVGEPLDLVDRFERNPRCVCISGQKRFHIGSAFESAEWRIYYNGDKEDVPDANIFHHFNRQSKKVMVSACMRWEGSHRTNFCKWRLLESKCRT